MSDLSFEQMLEESLTTIYTGAVVKGTVIDVRPDRIVLNVGYKSDGIITKNEYSSDLALDLTSVVKVGDELDAVVTKLNDGEGQVLLSHRRLAVDKANKRLEEAFENKEVLKAKVVKILDGGLSVLVDEARVFIPASLVSDKYESDLSSYAGQEVEFVITEFNPKRRRIIGNCRVLLDEKKQEQRKALFENLKVGDDVTGVVKNVTDFGVFVDIGGADGLLHISEMGWGRVGNPKKIYSVGDEVSAYVKEIENDKIALSMKRDSENPWNDAAVKYAVGNVVSGRVARMTDFGAFIELEPGIDALLHVSQISKEHVEKPKDVLKVNDVIEAKVVDFNEETKRISLSIRALNNNAEEVETVEE